MREIKFRIYDRENKHMVYSDKDCNNYLDNFFKEITDDKYPLLTIDNPLMQYTALKDKNNKEIYEGDVLEYTEDDIYLEDKKIKSKFSVKYKSTIDDDGNNYLGFYFPKECEIENNTINAEVIGNIYENSNLLENI